MFIFSLKLIVLILHNIFPSKKQDVCDNFTNLMIH
jgi:hypothetical protein